MGKLTVFYDSTCGFCVACRRWLEAQPSFFPLEFIPARTAAAARLLPGAASSRDELVALSDDGRVYRNAQAWIMCLYALREYRGWGERLSSPALLPFARQAFELLSRNRRTVSLRLGQLPEPELAEALRQMSVPTCSTKLDALTLSTLPRRRVPSIVWLAALLTALALLLDHNRKPILDWLAEQGILRDAPALAIAQQHGFRPNEKEAPMQYILWTYAAYLALSIALTIWVARTLHKNGRVFLVDTFVGNEVLADSVNHLLVVGFYLINIGYIALALREASKPGDAAASLEMLSTKVGLVLLVLGGMHFFNLYVFSRLRRRVLLRHLPPPVPPQDVLPPRPPFHASPEPVGVKA